jgi:hypothetical protein
MIWLPSSRGVFKELFGWGSSAMRSEGQAGAAADAAKSSIAGITRRDVIRRFITELTHAAAPRGKSKKLSSLCLSCMHQTGFLHSSASSPRHLRQTVSFQPFRWKRCRCMCGGE